MSKSFIINGCIKEEENGARSNSFSLGREIKRYKK